MNLQGLIFFSHKHQVRFGRKWIECFGMESVFSDRDRKPIYADVVCVVCRHSKR